MVYRLAGVAERLDARRLAGLAIGFAGVAALVGIDVGDSDPLAMAEVIVVALCYATGPLIISRRLRGLPNLAVVAASLVITAAIYTPPGLLDLPGSVSAETVAAVVTLALVCTVLAFALFFALIHEVGPARSTVITYVNPLVAVLLGVVLMGEPFTTGIAVGLPLILLGSVLGTAPALRGAAKTDQDRRRGQDRRGDDDLRPRVDAEGPVCGIPVRQRGHEPEVVDGAESDDRDDETELQQQVGAVAAADELARRAQFDERARGAARQDDDQRHRGHA